MPSAGADVGALPTKPQVLRKAGESCSVQEDLLVAIVVRGSPGQLCCPFQHDRSRASDVQSTPYVGVLLVASFAVLALGYSELRPITSDPTISVRPGPKVTDGARANLSAKIRVQSTLVLIPVTVVDPQYHFVTGFKREDLRLFEDRPTANTGE